MYPLKQSTSITIPIFCHDEYGDPVTGLVDGGFTKRISKNGGSFGAMSVTVTEMENGWYSLPISTSHSDTNGVLSVTLINAGCKQVNLQFRVFTDLFDDIILDIADVPIATENADALLGRTISGGASGGRTVTSAFRRIRNRTRIAGGTLYVYEEDDSSTDHTAVVTTAAGNPISEIDPA